MADARRAGLLLGVISASLVAVACASASAASALRIGAMFPLAGSAAPLAAEEYRGAAVAAQMVNATGGIAGRQVTLDLRDVETTAQVKVAADSLAADHVPAIIGAYSSELSIPAATAVSGHGLVYWETGAVADQLTGRGLPLVFRVGADGADLGGNSARFIINQIAPILHTPASALRVYLVTADDAYAHSVADAARAGMTAGGATITGEAVYNPYAPNWTPALNAIRTQAPDILILSSHIPDGIAFRRAFLAAGLHVRAFVGSTMAQCLPDFGEALGADAVGVFASDTPPPGFNARALAPDARTLYDSFAAIWKQQTGRVPSEEGIQGFSAAWVLFHDVLPHATALTPGSIAAAARQLDLPNGTLPNGGGVAFSSAPSQMGQNTRAAAVIWQWQAGPDHAVLWPVVWPSLYATGTIKLPLS